MKRITILGIPIDDPTRSGALEHINQLLEQPSQHLVATPNPEMLVEAHWNPAFKKVLQNTSLNLPDGIGLKRIARWFLGSDITERVTGTDVMHDLCMQKKPVSIFLLGAKEGIAETVTAQMKAANPDVRIVGTFAGSPRPEDEAGIIERINQSGAKLLFVAYGAPAQELWIARNLEKMPNVTVAMGVGGAFDFLAGTQKRAPQWMQTLGLEWLFRLIRQPSRLIRIWNATVVFPWLVMKSRLAGKESSQF